MSIITDAQAQQIGLIVLSLRPEYAKADADTQARINEEVMTLIINEGIRQVINEIEILNAYQPKKTRKAKK